MISSIIDTIGNTPLVTLNHYRDNHQISANIYGKVESFNPAGSVKDRVAKAMIEQAEADGLLDPDTVIIEATSGNTGIALAAFSAAKGYSLILTMPETMSQERIDLLKAYGAKIVLTSGDLGMKGAIDKAYELCQEYKNSWMPKQFENSANPKIHYVTTGPEIWQQTSGKIDVFVAGVGTGGTITGVGKYLKEQNPNIKIIAVEPQDSAVLSGQPSGKHKIQGIGAGFIPKVLDTHIYDDIIQVSNEDAFQTCNELARVEGILCGISSGAALSAAKQISTSYPEYQHIVVLLPDGGDRYLTTGVFQ